MALCTNVCIDLVVPASEVLKSFLKVEGVSHEDRVYLGSTADVASAFLHHANTGSAGERSCAPDVMTTLLGFANASPNARHYLGGNAALMGKRMAAMGVKVVLGGRIGPRARDLLPSSVNPAAPLSDTDDVHLILEYGKGEAFPGGSSDGSPRANRFIVTSGVPSEAADSVLETVSSSKGVGALVLSGLHALENLEETSRKSTLESMASTLATRSPMNLPVHVELASTATHAYSLLVARTIFPHASSLGFNEGELASLYEALGGIYINKGGNPANRGELAGTVPRVASVSYALRFIFREFPSLTRLHFHALPYHILAHKVPIGKKTHTPWSSNPGGSVAAGALACALQACDVSSPSAVTNASTFTTLCPSKLGVADGEIGSGLSSVRKLTLENPVASWVWALDDTFEVHFHTAPVPICANPTKTVGLGDTVSASALATDIEA